MKTAGGGDVDDGDAPAVPVRGSVRHPGPAGAPGAPSPRSPATGVGSVAVVRVDRRQGVGDRRAEVAEAPQDRPGVPRPSGGRGTPHGPLGIRVLAPATPGIA